MLCTLKDSLSNLILQEIYFNQIQLMRLRILADGKRLPGLPGTCQQKSRLAVTEMALYLFIQFPINHTRLHFSKAFLPVLLHFSKVFLPVFLHFSMFCSKDRYLFQLFQRFWLYSRSDQKVYAHGKSMPSYGYELRFIVQTAAHAPRVDRKHTRYQTL